MGQSNEPPETLERESLEWARRHIATYGDSDMLPRPFEYDAIASSWSSIVPDLERINLLTFESRPFQTFLVPKERGGYRVALRLDPIDAILYTAAVYEAAPLIEKARPPRRNAVACAYRIEIGPDGRFFPQDNGYGAFAKRARDWAEGDPDGFIVKADIADFYNHINIHRIQNALEMAGVAQSRAKAIERMLLSWTAKQSRGIPPGPHASNVLAEICLNDVDQKLAGEGLKHTRYADDFRIFCRKRGDADRALHTLSEYLFKVHGLSLAGHKTEVVPASVFAKVDDDPARELRQRKAAIVAKAVAEARQQREREAAEAARKREQEAAEAAARNAAEAAAAATSGEQTPDDAEASRMLDRLLAAWSSLPVVDYTDAEDESDVLDSDDDDDDDDDDAQGSGEAEPPSEGPSPIVFGVPGAVLNPMLGVPGVKVTDPAAPPSEAVPSDAEQTRSALVELFTEDLSAEVLRLGSIRHHFRRAANLNVDCLHDLTLPQLGDKLLPALRDALLYLQRTTRKPDRKRVARALLAAAKSPQVQFLPWAIEWLLSALVSSFFDCSPKRIVKLAEQAREHDQIGRRALALVARARRDVVWVRDFRRDWNAMPPWDKRALIWAGGVLTSSEQIAWKKQIEAGEALDKVVATHAFRSAR